MSRFTLRDLFWLTLVVALALAWSLTEKERRRSDIQAESMRKDVEEITSALGRNGITWHRGGGVIGLTFDRRRQ